MLTGTMTSSKILLWLPCIPKYVSTVFYQINLNSPFISTGTTKYGLPEFAKLYTELPSLTLDGANVSRYCIYCLIKVGA